MYVRVCVRPPPDLFLLPLLLLPFTRLHCLWQLALLDATADVWSIHADGVPVLAATDRTGHLLLPLRTRSAAAAAAEAQQTVQVGGLAD